MLWCCIEPARVEKTTPIMEALAAGFRGRLCVGEPPDDGEPFIVWGQIFTALTAIPKALAQGRPFYQLDNGFVDPARGGPTGYYRITYRSPSPVFWQDAPPSRIKRDLRPWRQSGSHIVIGLPGENFGRSFGIDCRRWIEESPVRELRRYTVRPITTRLKRAETPLAQDLRNAWALVTHSSNVAVDAVLAGIPVFCKATCPVAPVGNLDLAAIERPEMPDRGAWFNSLMAQQFTVDEMRSGMAREYLSAAIAGSRHATVSQ
ncbi:hypothetical protein [Bradyrhizobium sp. CCBAU 51753]|uniref:hypothetical protein n=1 Tax=Bradyrhizobium sp. CCBAU 51753 TaxID=1325100 RepID=UPI001889CDFC|nr:hypothetical protein [Bradyrhizobium sp. CCBAU 51753]QOZ25287.1 hypothetical protein XH93_18085 [Bradyrhizobium sp. CCBAU 51753]